MSFQNRKRIILQTVEDKGSVDVQELADSLRTSGMTIRRDLALLAEQGLIYRTRGGAMKISLAKDAFRFENKAAVRAEQKEVICQRAAREIQEGETIFLDCGSTVFRLCPYIRERRIRVITNSLPVVAELMGSQVQVNLAGGEIDPERRAVHGLMTEWHIGQYRADRAFIGVDGISLANGLSAHSEKEASTARAMAQQASRVYLLCDSSKLETSKYLQFAPLSMIDVMVTDGEADPELLNKYREAGLEILS